MKPRLKKGEHVVCAFAERCAGPGWANAPVWVIVQDGNGSLRKECLQPSDQSDEMLVMYNVSNEVSSLMKSFAQTTMRPAKVKKPAA